MKIQINNLRKTMSEYGLWRRLVVWGMLLMISVAAAQDLPDRKFPAGNYTPFGYLDNPYHTLWLNNSGLIRTAPPLGFRFREHETIIHLALTVNGRPYYRASDFSGTDLHSSYHSKNLFTYNYSIDKIEFQAAYFLESENAHGLNCEITLQNRGKKNAEVDLRAILSVPALDFDHYTAMNLPENGVLIRRFAEGPVYLFYAESTGIFRAVSASKNAIEKYRAGGTNDSLQEHEISVEGDFMAAVLGRRVSVAAGAEEKFRFTLIRDVAQQAALDKAKSALQNFEARFAELLQDDNRFWSSCPQLSGDWPEVWKRGLVYDWETLRMNVRRPIGMYKHHWDGMQVAIPRSVLAETAIDMFTYSYADPEIAKEVLLGIFADALAPNVPCMREDGSVNMVSESGSECGTAPSWCLPSLAIRSVYARTRDRQWARTLYPYMEDFLNWWFANRRNPDGTFFFDNSWESGQDQSSRFLIEQKTGGAGVQHIEPVDLHAAIADFARLLADFSIVLKQENDSQWEDVYQKYRRFLNRYWTGEGFRDIDRRSGEHTGTDFPYLWLPYVFNLTNDAQNAYLREKWRDSEYRTLSRWSNWSAGFQVVMEAMWNLGERALPAELAARKMDYLYSWWDRRTWETPDALPRAWGHIDRPANLLEYHPRQWDESFGMIDHSTNPHAPPRQHSVPIPGVAAEGWGGRQDRPTGMENYGWGATMPMHLIRGIIGYRDFPVNTDKRGFILAPSLPEKLFQPGKRLGMNNLHYADMDFDVMYEVTENRDIKATFTWRSERPAAFSIEMNGKTVAQSDGEKKSGSLSYGIENYGKSEIMLE